MPGDMQGRSVAANRGADGGMRLCLAASGGGHIRQMLDLEPVWGPYEHFFLSDDTPLSRSIAKEHRVHFITAVALGQARIAGLLKMLSNGLRGFVQSGRIILRERPHVLITTGAGSTFSAVLWARLLGAKIVIIESFARFESLSAFSRVAGPLAHHRIVQSQALTAFWPDAPVFDPLKILPGAPRPAKKPLLFATVGTVLPFDRLITSVATLKTEGAIEEEVVAQTGVGGVRPDGLQSVETLPFDSVREILKDADIVVCHGGTGSLITALREGCRVVAVPRRSSYGEHYDDHQFEITRAFAMRGLVAVAETPEELRLALQQVREREPVAATSDPSELIAHLRGLIERWTGTAARHDFRWRPLRSMTSAGNSWVR